MGPGRILPVAVTLEAERPRSRVQPGKKVETDEQSDPTAAAVTSVTIDLVFEEAFEDLYARAYGVAYQLLGRRSESEDVAQETLARAFVRWRRIRSYAEAWVVRTPSLDGPATSLELLDASASVFLSISSARWPGTPEPSPWRELLERL